MPSSIEPKKLVRDSYDREAARYASSSSMQSQNLLRLLDVAEPFLPSDPTELRVLDAGCGLGNAIQELKARPSFRVSSYHGIDLSPEMIHFAQEHFRSDNIEFSVGDLEYIEFADGAFNLVISNSVLHWLNQPACGLRVDGALAELYRILKPNGLLAISVAAIGTGRRFNRAYRATVDELKLVGSGSLIEDPVGCMQLHDVVDALLHSGFEIDAASLEYEPVTFASAAEYANAVRAYGFEMFTAHAPAERREEIWASIFRRFTEANPDKPYRHDQYMIYVAATKP
jgi:SAM-dependent methyltransferase